MLRWCFLLMFTLLGTNVCRSEEHSDTLWTADSDRIILTYDIRQHDEEISIKFLEARTALGRLHAKKYKKPEKVDVVFFDKTGVYSDARFTNITPAAFMVPSGLKYSKSKNGYYFLRYNPTISFTKHGKNIDKVTIPIYLAYEAGDGVYKLFAVCNRLEIALKPSSTIARGGDSPRVAEALDATMEIEGEDEEAIAVLTCIDAVEMLLEAQTKVPFSDGLQYELTKLRQYQEKVKDRALTAKIKETLTNSEIKKMELEAKATQEAEEARMTAQKMAEEQEREAMARQDSIAMVQEKKAEAEKKRNLWLVIGGAVLAVLCFVGNQFLQHFRNVKNQKNMMAMSQQMAHQAESAAKRQAQNFARSKTKDVANQVKQRGQNMVRDKAKNLGNTQKSKNISI